MLREYQEEINRLKKMLENPAMMKQMMESTTASSPTKASIKKHSAEQSNGNVQGQGNEKSFDSGEKKIYLEEFEKKQVEMEKEKENLKKLAETEKERAESLKYEMQSKLEQMQKELIKGGDALKEKEKEKEHEK